MYITHIINGKAVTFFDSLTAEGDTVADKIAALLAYYKHLFIVKITNENGQLVHTMRAVTVVTLRALIKSVYGDNAVLSMKYTRTVNHYAVTANGSTGDYMPARQLAAKLHHLAYNA